MAAPKLLAASAPARLIGAPHPVCQAAPQKVAASSDLQQQLKLQDEVAQKLKTQRYQNGALGTVTASQISHGRENDLWIEIDGTKGALEWHQEDPNKLMFRVNGQPHRMYTRDPNAPYLTDIAKGSCRLPSGQPDRPYRIEGQGMTQGEAVRVALDRAAPYKRPRG